MKTLAGGLAPVSLFQLISAKNMWRKAARPTRGEADSGVGGSRAGISGGCLGTLTTVVLPRFLGRAHLRAIAGVQIMLIVIASAIGPSLLANFKAITGSYSSGLYTCCLFAPVVIVLMLFVQSPTEINAIA